MTPKHNAKPSRRELVKMAGAGVLGLGTLQGAGTPRKLLYADFGSTGFRDPGQLLQISAIAYAE